MTIRFNIPYNTYYGQTVFIYGSIPELAGFDIRRAVPLVHNEGGVWICELKDVKKSQFQYSYFIKDPNGYIRYECGGHRSFIPSEGYDNFFVYDEWKPFTDETPFRSKAFRDLFFKRDININNGVFDTEIICTANNLSPDRTLHICGSSSYLGGWITERSKAMNYIGEGKWSFKFNYDGDPFEYKFIIKTSNQDEISYTWEEGENRCFAFKKSSSIKINITHFSLNLPAIRPRYAGTSIPVFSLRSKFSCGVGDFFDLELFGEFLEATGQRVLQILPVNDTTDTLTWLDSYPYRSISVYALHPIYLNPYKAGIPEDMIFYEEFLEKAETLNKEKSLNYEETLKLKWRYIKVLFTENWDRTKESEEFKEYFKNNEFWLKDYALFSFLTERNGSADFRRWKKYSKYDTESLISLTSSKSKVFNDIAIYYFVQFHLHKQLTEAKQSLNKRGIILKGDIPIGISRNSVEAWKEPELFNFEVQAGAPPDDFSEFGQNWGFPTYNWTLMERDGFLWWKRRLNKMSEYFDAYRLDHILGFFRIWEIPVGFVSGVLGGFNPSIPLSVNDIFNFGYNFEYDRDCTPYIKEELLRRLFGVNSNEIVFEFLELNNCDRYSFKRKFTDQESIYKYFETNRNSRISPFKDKIASLFGEVLFIKDQYDYKKYHPRINAFKTFSFEQLDESQKERFLNIYNHFFSSRNNHFWHHIALKKLPGIITSTTMMACGEDLGMVPESVAHVMNRLGILSLEIERMPKSLAKQFSSIEDYNYLSVCSPGTHDTSTLAGWWLENRSLTQKYYNEILKMEGSAPEEINTEICEKIIERHLSPPSMLTIIPIQDWLLLNENFSKKYPDEQRINNPSVADHYWRYRVEFETEELLCHIGFINKLRSMVQIAGRG